jgi:hypothetical protein
LEHELGVLDTTLGNGLAGGEKMVHENEQMLQMVQKIKQLIQQISKKKIQRNLQNIRECEQILIVNIIRL